MASGGTYIYILVRYSAAGMEIYGTTALYEKAESFEKQHADNRALMARLEKIEKDPLKPIKSWPG